MEFDTKAGTRYFFLVGNRYTALGGQLDFSLDGCWCPTEAIEREMQEAEEPEVREQVRAQAQEQAAASTSAARCSSSAASTAALRRAPA